MLGIGTHEELAQELDNLVTGVASVAELEASTADLLQDLHGPAPARLAAKRGGVASKS